MKNNNEKILEQLSQLVVLITKNQEIPAQEFTAEKMQMLELIKNSNYGSRKKTDTELQAEAKRTAAERAEEVARETKELVVIMKRLTTVEKIPKEGYAKLPAFEREYFKHTIIPKYGDRISPRDRELLRSKAIMLKDGVPHLYDGFMEQNWEKPRPLTPKEIDAELAQQAEYDRYTAIGALPEGEIAGVTREEWPAYCKKKAEEEAKKPKRLTREDGAVRTQEFGGRKVTEREVENYMWEHEMMGDRQERLMAERRERNKDKTSFKAYGAHKIKDSLINKVLKYCIIGYVVYNYPGTVYLGIAGGWAGRIIGTIILYIRLRMRAKVPFTPDRYSKFSEAHQYMLGEKDRKRWGYDKKDKKDK